MKTNSSEGFNLNEWVRITPDGDVTIVVSKTEMGQGVYTSLAMIVADELEADWNRVRVVSAPVRDEYKDPVFGLQNTGGSSSVRNMYEHLRRAGAQAREMLEMAAAEEWGVPVTECTAFEGTVRNEKSHESLPYGKLAARASTMRPPGEPSLKSREEFRLIGNSLPRLDIPSKVQGTATFGLDIFQEGMLYASVARPPTFGAALLSIDEESAAKTLGVKAVVRIDRGVAVCAETISAAWAGKKALNAQWDSGSDPDMSTASLEQTFADALDRDGLIVRDDGDVESALAAASRGMTATYALPYLAHCTFEPMNCTAHVQADRCEVWCPAQLQGGALDVAHKETGLRPEQIHVHTTYVGGGFGRRLENDFVQEAVQIAKGADRPVKLVWTREEDMRYDLFRPGSASRIEAAFDNEGKLIAWFHKIAVSSILERFAPQFMAGNNDPSATEGISDMEYGIPNLRVEWVKTDTPVPVGFWRSVGHSGNAFVVESFIDELAHAVREDPLGFRLKLLRDHPRPSALLKKVAEESDWRGSRGQGRGKGIAQHFSFGSYAAAVADVSVDREKGAVRVERIVCAIDCGSFVNPDAVVAQMEGATCMGLSVALKEQVRFENGGVKSSNFEDYQLLSMSEVPEIAVHLVESGKALGGVGEPGVPPVAPAVANAVFDAVGLRIRRLPMTPDTVKQAGTKA